MHAQNRSEFDTWITLNNLTCERVIYQVIKSGPGSSSKNNFNGYVFNDKTNLYLNMFISDVECLNKILR